MEQAQLMDLGECERGLSGSDRFVYERMLRAAMRSPLCRVKNRTPTEVVLLSILIEQQKQIEALEELYEGLNQR